MPHIIVVDDDDDFRETIMGLLARAGYTVTGAINGNDGLTKCLDIRPDLVVTDIIMPDREGLELIMDMKKKLPDTPIIAVSGGGRQSPESYLPLAEKFGADCTLTKPFPKKDLLKAAEVLLV